jgi:hypothetical protein
MMHRLLAGGACAVLLLASTAGASNLSGRTVEDGLALPVVPATGICCMQKGFVTSLGIGCSNAFGTSGGPNDCAEGLTLCTAAPVDVKTFSYVVQTPGIPGFVTGCAFAAWSDAGAAGGPPGTTVCVGPAIPFATFGAFSVPVTGCKITTASTAGGHFYAGLKQGGIGGMRWGYQTAGAVVGDAWIRASGCGAAAFGSLTGFGFPGAWVFRVCVDQQGPIEVEEFSWGSIKAKYQ